MKINHSYGKITSIAFLFVLINIFLQFTANAQSLSPLEVGNIWVYQETGTNDNRIKLTLTDTININGYKYFICKRNNVDSVFQYLRLRDDGVYVRRMYEKEYPYFKKNFSLNDTIYHSEWFGIWKYIVRSEVTENVFGKNITAKNIFINWIVGKVEGKWSDEFGLISGNDLFTNNYYVLKGCVISGILYGDTASVITSVKTNVVENNFLLAQNYPNPFNPTTTIQYTIPALTPRERVSVGQVRVTLVVYDMLGRAVATLVNEEKQPGNYEVKFDASKLSSGVYFCKLTNGANTLTRKMLLMK